MFKNSKSKQQSLTKTLNRDHFYNDVKKLIMCLVILFSISIVSHVNALDQNCIAYFPFSNDASELIQGNHGIEIGQVEYVQGKKGYAAKFNGDSYIEVDGKKLGLREWTLSFWVKIDEKTSERWYAPVGKLASTFEGITGRYNYAYCVYYNMYTDFQYESEDSDNDHLINPGSRFVVGTWYHVVNTRSANGDYKYYVNGVLKSTRSYTDEPLVDNERPLLIGGKITSLTKMFKGEIDELRIYSVAIKDTNVIQELYEAEEELPTCPNVSKDGEVIYVEVPVEIETIIEVEIPVEKIIYKENDTVTELVTVKNNDPQDLINMRRQLAKLIENINNYDKDHNDTKSNNPNNEGYLANTYNSYQNNNQVYNNQRPKYYNQR